MILPLTASWLMIVVTSIFGYYNGKIINNLGGRTGELPFSMEIKAVIAGIMLSAVIGFLTLLYLNRGL